MHKSSVLIVVLVWISGATTAQLILPEPETNVETYRVFGFEHPGPYKHPAAITELANGDLYIAYYGGANEYDDATAVYGSRLEKGKSEWSFPVAIADTPFRGEGNPVVWQAPDGIVWLFYVNRFADTWSSARVKAKISKDGAVTWSDSFMLTMEEGTMVRGQPIVLDNGDYLLPIYLETGDDREMTASTTSSFFLRYSPEERVWTETNRIQSPKGNLQAQVVQLSAKRLLCFLRRGGNYLPTKEGWMLKSTSEDGGYIWSDAVATDIPNPNSAVELIKLKSGNLFLVYNHNMNDRTPLTVALSEDGGETFPYRRNIGGGDNSFAYPYAIQTQDGKIHVIYTTNDRTSIMHAVLQEEGVRCMGKKF